jgi:peptide chain release factor 1
MEYSKNLFASLQKIKEKYNELNDKINSADTTPQQFIETSKQIKKFVPIIELYDEYMRLIENTKQAEELAGKNDELAELARMEIADAHERLPLLEEKIKILMLPSDPNNEKNILVEMRPAAGGDEASIFVSNLFETYQIYCKKQG